MSRKLLDSHKAIIQQACELLANEKISKDQCIQQILNAFEDPKEVCAKITSSLDQKESNFISVIDNLVMYLQTFKLNTKIGHNVKTEVWGSIRECLNRVKNSKTPDVQKFLYNYNFWSEHLLVPMMNIKDHKWFFDVISDYVQYKEFFAFTPEHTKLAEQLCTRETFYTIKNFVFKNGWESGLFVIDDHNVSLTVLMALQHPKVTDEQLIAKFQDGTFTWRVEYWEDVAATHSIPFTTTETMGGKPTLNIERRKLFEFAVKQGYTLTKPYETCGTALYWLTRKGQDWIKYIMDNFPHPIDPADFGSAIVEACCLPGDQVDFLEYLLVECKASKDYWAAPHSALIKRNLKCFEACLKHEVLMKPTYFVDQLKEIEKELPDLFTRYELIRKYWLPCSTPEELLQRMVLIENNVLDEDNQMFSRRTERAIFCEIKFHRQHAIKSIFLAHQEHIKKNNPDFVNFAAFVKNWAALELLIDLGFAVNYGELGLILPRQEQADYDAKMKEYEDRCSDPLLHPSSCITKRTKQMLFRI